MELNDEELDLLRDILHEAMTSLMNEINHADSFGYKKMLRHRRELLDSLVARMGMKHRPQPELTPEPVPFHPLLP